MANKTEFLELVALQKNALAEENHNLIRREIFPRASGLLKSDNRILVITGMRRVGKSTLLKQLIKSVDGYCYLNAEDERLIHFRAEQFSELHEALIEAYGDGQYFFFDEIQNIANFEVIVRRLQDSGKKVIITGSNSSLLSIELGTRLTGRYIQIELFPFSFKEFLDFNKVHPTSESFLLPAEKVKLKQHFKQWLDSGGLPEYLKYGDVNYLRTLFDNIIYRDIIARYNIRKQSTLKELVHLLANNLSLPVTYNSLKNSVGLSNAETAREYISYLCNSYFFFELRKFSPSYNKQIQNAKKIYLIDNAFHNMLSLGSQTNAGRKLENVIHLFFRSKNFDLFYFNENSECDFVAIDPQGNKQLVQSCWELTPSNKTREINGLTAAMKYFDSENGLIITFDQEDEMQTPAGTILVKPVWKYLLKTTF